MSNPQCATDWGTFREKIRKGRPAFPEGGYIAQGEVFGYVYANHARPQEADSSGTIHWLVNDHEDVGRDQVLCEIDPSGSPPLLPAGGPA